mmetsp:Transcript_6047/g.23964  ORF Transcript_6047/g.23964 Transcript_6047/m.23964 type:complete len:473 (+) Transcript_6047:145-1563(+)
MEERKAMRQKSPPLLRLQCTCVRPRAPFVEGAGSLPGAFCARPGWLVTSTATRPAMCLRLSATTQALSCFLLSRAFRRLPSLLCWRSTKPLALRQTTTRGKFIACARASPLPFIWHRTHLMSSPTRSPRVPRFRHRFLLDAADSRPSGVRGPLRPPAAQEGDVVASLWRSRCSCLVSSTLGSPRIRWQSPCVLGSIQLSLVRWWCACQTLKCICGRKLWRGPSSFSSPSRTRRTRRLRQFKRPPLGTLQRGCAQRQRTRVERQMSSSSVSWRRPCRRQYPSRLHALLSVHCTPRITWRWSHFSRKMLRRASPLRARRTHWRQTSACGHLPLWTKTPRDAACGDGRGWPHRPWCANHARQIWRQIRSWRDPSQTCRRGSVCLHTACSSAPRRASVIVKLLETVETTHRLRAGVTSPHGSARRSLNHSSRWRHGKAAAGIVRRIAWLCAWRRCARCSAPPSSRRRSINTAATQM